MANEKRGAVYLVGAGPGAADLITVRGAQLLRRADVVVYDYLVNEDLLQLAAPAAELIYAGKIGHGERAFDQTALNQILIERASRGLEVVRLKGGDPFIFGRGGEEGEALAAAGIRFEVVPGVTSAIAVPAYAGIPLTHREYGSFVAFVTGHEDAAKSDSTVPWAELARAASQRGTLVLLMATARIAQIAEKLMASGLDSATPAAAIQHGTSASQKTVSATLGTIAAALEQNKIGAPAIIVIGECARLRERLAWFERRPLFGRRIVVTRARTQASRFAAALREAGAEVVESPTIETVAPDDYGPLDQQLARLSEFDWIIFTSATGVESFFARLAQTNRDVRELSRASIAAIGPATAASLRNFGLKVAAVPAEFRAEAIVAALGDEKIRGARFLIPRAQVAREAILDLLKQKQAVEVTAVAAYKTVIPKSVNRGRIAELIKGGAIDLVAFTSSSTVTNFCAMIGCEGAGLKAAVIGPITAQTARERGFEIAVSPERYTVPALTRAIIDYFSKLP